MKRKFNQISMSVVAIVLFFGVLLLSVERDEEGTWGFAMVSALADGESGSGEDGNGTGETPCTAYDYNNMLLKLVTCVLPWQQKLECKQPAENKCCKADSQKGCSGTGWPSIPGV